MRQQLIVLLYFILNNFVQSSSNPNDFVQRRVAHGTRPPSFTYPYTSQVRLALIHRDSNRYTCTGTIITDMVVLTAAHCLKDFVNITVGYNGFTIQALTLIKAKRWFVHPFYQTKDLDIGLIETETSMKLTSSIQASYQGRWITSTAELAAHSKPSVLCGWGEHENRVAGDLSCIKFTRLDQACLLYQHDPEFSWCFYYPRAPNGGENTYTNVCYGDSGAGIFPGKNLINCLNITHLSSIQFKFNSNSIQKHPFVQFRLRRW